MGNGFLQWFNEKLITSGYPHKELAGIGKELSKYDIIVNVSDEYYSHHAKKAIQSGCVYHWFPLGQTSNNMGMVSLFGALHVLYQASKQNQRVLLHCRKGENRSLTVRDCLFFMLTGKHNEVAPNILIVNCQKEHLPPLENIEKWLLRCNRAFANYLHFKGNMLDWVFSELNSTNYGKSKA